MLGKAVQTLQVVPDLKLNTATELCQPLNEGCNEVLSHTAMTYVKAAVKW